MTPPLEELIRRAELTIEAICAERSQAEHDLASARGRIVQSETDERVVREALGVLRGERRTYVPGKRRDARPRGRDRCSSIDTLPLACYAYN